MPAGNKDAILVEVKRYGQTRLRIPAQQFYINPITSPGNHGWV
jgi:hypothetical protein